MKGIPSVLAVAGVLWLVPSAAAADWYANPFLGQMASIKFTEPTADGPSLWGISGGAAPAGYFGGEFDYSVSNGFFGDKVEIGANKLRTVSGNAVIGYPIKIAEKTRLRPYGTFGGGVGLADQGLEFFPNFDAVSNLPPQQQNQIYNCFQGLGENASRQQVAACGVSVLEEPGGTSYHGMLSFGGGVFGFLASHIGARADFRYFKQVVPSDEEGKLNFWRYTVGLVIH